MRRRSRKNSRPWEDLAFRAQYRAEHPYCELTPWLRKNIPAFRKMLNAAEDTEEIHHLIGGNGRRWDVRTNLIATCRTVHDWFHANLTDGRVLGVWLKVTKGEFDEEEFRRAAGYMIAGWLMKHVPSDAFLAIYEELKSRFP